MTTPFNEKEIENFKMVPGAFGGPDYPEFNYPVTHKENYRANMDGEGYWVPTSNDVIWFCPAAYPDNPAKGNVHEAVPYPQEKLGGLDMFGIEWTYDPVIGGSTVMPGAPMLDDANNWKTAIAFPDINSWDWDECVKTNLNWLTENNDRLVNLVICTGWFERLISFMDFQYAAIALIDDDQREALNELFERLTDLYIEVVERFLLEFPGLIHGVTMHDDWGAQRAPFFGIDTVEEVLVNPQKRMVDYLHSKGLYADMHCCGAIDMLLPCIDEIGYDRLEAMPLVDKDAFSREYGDKMMLTYTPDVHPEDATNEEVRQAARYFVDRYFNKGKKCILETYYQPLPTEFLKELYRYSRKKASN